ncbi:MAG: O-antigen ligase family protein [Clostridia bacterium]|nr:O-antigen ligase family protein [Clostridia bacterium]
MKKNKDPENKNLFEGSRIFGALTRFSDWICGKFSDSSFGGFLNSYDKTEKLCSESAIISGIKRLFGFDGKGAKAKRKVASVIENSFFTRAGQRIFEILGNTYLSVVGMFFLSFGIYTLFAGLIKAVALRQEDASFLYFIIPFVCIPLSVPMFLSGKKRLVSLLSESKLISPLLFSVFGLRRELLSEKNTTGGRRNIAFIIGTVLGVSTYFLPPVIVLAAPFVLLGAYAIILSPEAGMVITLFSIPLLILTGHPSLFLAFVLIFLTFCYVMKAVRGKRYVRFEAVDFFVLLFILFFASGALGGFGGIDVSLPLYICLSAGYFLCANMFSSRIWLKRGVIALMAGNMLSSLFAIYQYISGNVDTVWLDTENFSNIAGRAVSFFENPNMLGEYAMMLLPVSVALVISAKARRERSAWLCVAVATGLCLIFTWARGAWLGALAAFFIFAVLYTKKTIPFMLLCLVLVPFLPVVLPESIVSRMTSIGDMSDSSTSYRFFIYKSAFDMIADFFLTGIGAGNKNFSAVYVSYSYSGIESAPHAHNLFFQLMIELGVLGLLVFLAAMTVYIQKTVTAINKEKDTYLRGLQLACACGVFASLVQGMTDYVWYNYRVYFVFFALMGIGVAAARCGERARERESMPSSNSPVGADIAFIPVKNDASANNIIITPENNEEAVKS